MTSSATKKESLSPFLLQGSLLVTTETKEMNQHVEPVRSVSRANVVIDHQRVRQKVRQGEGDHSRTDEGTRVAQEMSPETLVHSLENAGVCWPLVGTPEMNRGEWSWVHWGQGVWPKVTPWCCRNLHSCPTRETRSLLPGSLSCVLLAAGAGGGGPVGDRRGGQLSSTL